MAPHELVITTPRLLLRDWDPDNAEHVQAILRIRSDPRGLTHVSSLPPADLAACRKFMVDEQANEGYFAFIVELRDPEQPQRICTAENIIGFVGGYPAPMFGYVFDSNFWGHGYATEATRACFDAYWATWPNGHPSLSEDDRSRILLKILAANRASIAVAQKLGGVRVRQEMSGKAQPDGTKPLVPWEIYELQRPNALDKTT